MIMVWYSCADPWLLKMQDQTSLMLLWRSFLGGDSDMRTTVFAHNGGHHIRVSHKVFAQSLDYPRCKTNNRWRSVDAHF